MRKRFFAWLLAGVLAVGTLTGCGEGAKNTESESKSVQPGKNEEEHTGAKVNGIDISETYEATMVLIGNQQADQDKVLEKVNEILMRDLNTKLNIVMLSMGDFTTQLPLMLQGGDKVDLVPVINSFAGTFINNKMIIDLNSYVEKYGVNMKKAFSEMGEELLYTGCINEFMFGVPVVHGSSGVSTVCMRADWLEEAGFQAEDIKGINDMEKVYEAVQKNHPEAVMMWINKGNPADSRYETSDPLTDFNGVLLNYGEKPKVVNYFASDAYKEMVTRHYNWAQKGWISKDAATTTDQPSTAVQAGRAFSYYTPGGADAEASNSASCGTAMLCVPVTEGQLTTTGFCWNSWGIAQSSKNPERAFLLLDYLYNSGEVMDLINYGIKDVHYVVGEDGLYRFPEGIDVTNAAYSFNQAWELPNPFLGGIWEGNDPDLYKKQIELTKEAQRSCALGFAYDSSSLSTEIASLSNVKSQYIDALNAGAVNPKEELPKFLDALDNAGMQKVITEKQAQLDAWTAAKNGQ